MTIIFISLIITLVVFYLGAVIGNYIVQKFKEYAEI